MTTKPLTRPLQAEPTDDWVAAVMTHGLSKRYGASTALTEIDLWVPNGAVYMLAGENGAGKSTLLRVLLNLERATDGQAEVMGLIPARQGARVRARVGYVPERSDIGPRWMTVGQWFAERAVYYPSWDADYAALLCRRLDIDLTQRLGRLSKGQARRVQIVASLAYRPPLLLLDEPTDGLDPVARDTILELLSDHLAETGCTILASTHLIYELDALVDHIGVLSHGRLTAQMSRDDLQRTLKGYRLVGPEGWEGPLDLPGVLNRGRFGREHHWIVRGDEAEITADIVRSGGEVRDVTALNLHDAVLHLMRAGVVS
jgi:ABC-2 type transport system ATP-binding protein